MYHRVSRFVQSLLCSIIFRPLLADPEVFMRYLISSVFSGSTPVGFSWKTSNGSHPGVLLIRCLNQISWLLSVQRVQTPCEGKLSSASSVHNLILSCHYQQTRADHRQRRSTWIAALPSVSASSSPPQSKQRRITADVTPICCHSWTRPPDIWSPLVSFHK